MPGARTHDLITLVTAAGADLAYLQMAPHPDPALAGLFTASYLFAGFACAGDLDLNSKEYRRWGPFRFLWWPYRQLMPHRSRFSHGILLGGIVRILYLGTVGTLLFWMLLWLYNRLGPHVDASAVTREEWQSVFGFAQAHPLWTAALLTGFILAGTTHTIADLISTWLKRRF